MIRKVLFLFLLLPAMQHMNAQSPEPYDLAALMRQQKINVFNREATIIPDTGLYLSEKASAGVAWIEGLEFSNGVIEVDIKGRDLLQRSFVGIAFHAVDEKTADAVYFRPFNFRNTDAVRKLHAVQYVSLPDFPWNVLRDKFPGQYEKPVVSAPAGDSWFHVKIAVSYPEIKVFVNRNPVPSLTVKKLNTRTTGKIGLWVDNGSDGSFANLTVTKAK